MTWARVGVFIVFLGVCGFWWSLYQQSHDLSTIPGSGGFEQVTHGGWATYGSFTAYDRGRTVSFSGRGGGK